MPCEEGIREKQERRRKRHSCQSSGVGKFNGGRASVSVYYNTTLRYLPRFIIRGRGKAEEKSKLEKGRAVVGSASLRFFIYWGSFDRQEQLSAYKDERKTSVHSRSEGGGTL